MGFEVINRIKKEKGLTNAQLAEMSGVTLSTLDKITAGINTNPKLATLRAICSALGCRLDDFDDEPPTPTTDQSATPDKEQPIEPIISNLIDSVQNLTQEQAAAVSAFIRYIKHQ